jgi:hypothetical protein
MMAPDLIETIARVQEELAAQIEILDRDGGVYALRYLESFGQPKRVNPPEAPLGMSPHIRRMIREQVADELAARRHPGDGLRTIWRERLILGTLNVIAGPPGAGKSSLTALIAAELSRAGATLVISNAEDDPGSVTIPRLTAAGAILERIHVIPPDDAPLFPAEIEGLETVLRETSIRCVFLDPIGAHFRPERLVNDRPRLRQLAGVARRTGAAIIGVHHTTKTTRSAARTAASSAPRAPSTSTASTPRTRTAARCRARRSTAPRTRRRSSSSTRSSTSSCRTASTGQRRRAAQGPRVDRPRAQPPRRAACPSATPRASPG